MEIIDNAWETTTKIKPNFIVSFKTYSLVTGALIILNIVLYNYATNTSGYLDSEINLTSSLFTMLIAFPVVSFILAVLFALIPHKEKAYSQKYVPMALFILFVMHSITFISRCKQRLCHRYEKRPLKKKSGT
jgi:hypothetical protein